MARTTSLFKYVLGNRFEELPAPLRAMLESRETHWYRGTAAVTRGSNRLSHTIGGLMGLPRKAHEVPVALEIVPGVHRETWTRHFGRKTLRTALRAGGRAGRGRIVERVGGVSLSLELTVEGGDLVYRTRSASLFGLPLPRFLAPSVEARAGEEDGKLVIESATRAGSIGRLLRYRLALEPGPISEADAIAAARPTADARDPLAREPATPAAPAKPPAADPAAVDLDETQVLAKAAAPDPDETQVLPTGDRAAPPAGADTGEETIVARKPAETAPASQRAAHPAEPGAPTVPIDTQHARPGGDKKSEPPRASERPRPAAPGEATIPVSPSRRRTSPKGDA